MLEHIKAEIAVQKARLSKPDLLGLIQDLPKPINLKQALANPGSYLGEIANTQDKHFNPMTQAQQLQNAGASALRILTSNWQASGDLSHLQLAKNATALPCIRNDNIIETYQIYESRAFGADAVNLKHSLLDFNTLQDLYALATQLNLTIIIECQTPDQLKSSLHLPEALVMLTPDEK